jgi:hypothetical protein
LSHKDGWQDGERGSTRTAGCLRGSIPFSAFWLRSSVVSVLISLISDTRVIDSHDINLIFLGCGSIRQLAARTRARRLGFALPPWLAQPSPSSEGPKPIPNSTSNPIHFGHQTIQAEMSHSSFVFHGLQKNSFTGNFLLFW